MKLVGRYSLNLFYVLAIVLGVMLTIQLWHLDRSTRAMKELGESSLMAQLDEQVESRAQSIAQMLADNVAEPYLRLDMMAIYELLLPVVSRESVNEVFLIDRQGNIVHDASHEIALFGEPVMSFAPDIDPALNVPQRLFRSDSYAAVEPVFAGGQHLASVYVSLSRSQVAEQLALLKERFDAVAHERRDRNLRATAVGAACIILIGMLLSVIGARRMARPILALVDETRRVARGDYNVEIDIQRRDELGELATAFRHMTSELELKTRRISFLAFNDHLTTLPNRTAFSEAVETRLQEDSCSAAAVLFMDLDEFKRVNDTLGHDAGDQMLAQLGPRLRESVYALGFVDLDFEGAKIPPVARWGGDEFTLFLDGVTDVERAVQIAQQIVAQMRKPLTVGTLDIVTGATVGVALYPSDSDNIQELLGFADVAMYHAKQRGDVRVQPYTPSMREAGAQRLSLESDLRTALANEQMCLLYEPIYDPLSESVLGVEARLLWRHPEVGVLEPSAFMAVAESIDIAGDITCWVIDTALDAFAARAPTDAVDYELTINLSSAHIERERLVDTLAGALERNSMDSRNLILELSELRLFRNVLHAVPMLNDVRAMGVQVWMDEFGSGYAAINRLRRMPLDGMKLDPSLVAGVDHTTADQNLSAAVIALAHSLGLRVGADGVASQTQLDFLRRTGCDTVQGQHFGKPGALEHIAPGFVRAAS